MSLFRKKPVVIEAVRWTGDVRDIGQVFALIPAPADDDAYAFVPANGTLEIPTREGVMTASPGDWIIRGIQGELYPCKPGIFDATYEAVE